MGKSRHYDRELKLLDKLKHENKKLKQENSRLRKQIDRLDVDRYQQLQELVQQQCEEERQVRREETLKEEWACYECKIGILRLLIVNRRDGVFYYRSCNCCSKRTKLQKYSKNVRGYVGNEDAN